MPPTNGLPKTEPNQSQEDQLRKSLLSIGVDKNSVERLTSSRELGRIVVPIYWKDGIVQKANLFWLQNLPEFARDFAREFPDGQLRWDMDYRGEKAEDGDVAIHVIFYYQEDDQGDHWSPKPDAPQEESYYRLLKRLSFKGEHPIQASRVIYGR